MCTWAHERGLGMTSLPLSTLRFRHSKPVFRLLCYFLSLFLVKRLLLYRIICFCLIFRFLIHVPLSFCNKKYFIIRLKRLFHHTLKILNGNAERRRLASMDDVNYSKVLNDEFCWNTCEMLKFRICMSLDADRLTCMESIYLKSFFTELAKSQTMPTELVVMHECRIIPYNRHHIRTYFGREKIHLWICIFTMEVYVIVLVIVLVLVWVCTYCLMHIRIVLKISSGFIILQSMPSPL